MRGSGDTQMTFQKGRAKTGGRQTGVLNKYVSVPQTLEKLGYEPIKHLVELLKAPLTVDYIEDLNGRPKPVIRGISDEIKATKILELLKFMHPTLQAAQLTIDNPSEELQNEKTEAMYAQLKAMLLDQPKDIECPGQTSLSPQDSTSSPSGSSTESSEPKSSD